MIEMPVPRAENVRPPSDGGSNNVVVVRVVRHNANNVLLPRFNACGSGLKVCHGTLDPLVIQPVHAFQTRIAERAAHFLQNEFGDDQNVWGAAEPSDALLCGTAHAVYGTGEHIGIEDRPHYSVFLERTA